MTRQEFRKRASALFAERNPDASIKWLASRFVTYPTGVKGWYGKFEARAPGYRTRTMLARGDADSIMIN